MNKQLKIKRGRVVGRGIQWTDYTWNPIAGCKHGCRWTMPDGSVAICYAEEIANKFTRAYPQGFEHAYWHPKRLSEPLGLAEPSKIFMDSMSDFMGAWVGQKHIDAVLGVVRRCPQHAFQLLTKNAPRLLTVDLPSNVWAGASSPPDVMHGHAMTPLQREKMLDKTLDVLSRVEVPVRWMSIEPLSWDVSSIIEDHAPLQWAVIGAATNGPRVYQPNPRHVERLLEVFDDQGVPVFFKGNLWGNDGIDRWREYFPGFEPSPFMQMELGAHAVPVQGRAPSSAGVAISQTSAGLFSSTA